MELELPICSSKSNRTSHEYFGRIDDGGNGVSNAAWIQPVCRQKRDAINLKKRRGTAVRRLTLITILALVFDVRCLLESQSSDGWTSVLCVMMVS